MARLDQPRTLRIGQCLCCTHPITHPHRAMRYFVITSDYGRIGPFWWFNSDTRIFRMGGLLYSYECVEWGRFGIGRNVHH